MTERLIKIINKNVYENSAEYPWAKLKDFVISSDARSVDTVFIVSLSLVPVPYAVLLSDFEVINEKRAVLKPGVKPRACKIPADNPRLLSGLRKKKILVEGKKLKILDVSFDTEIGEIIDYIAAAHIIGKREYLSFKDVNFK